MYDIKFHSKDLAKYSFLVTGGAGFIGSNLVEYLIKYGAKKVRVLDNLSNGFYKNIRTFEGLPNFEFVKGDIRDLDTCMAAVQGIDLISHQAALGSVPRSINDPKTSNDVNVGGFLNMLIALKENPSVNRMVYAASSSTYGDSKALPKVEDRIGKPLSPYAVTKFVNELYADVFGKTYGVKTVGLRYFNVFGPRQDPKGAYAAVIPLFINAIIENKSPMINGGGTQPRDFTFVENAVQANIKSLLTDNEDALNQVYNVAVGDRTSLTQMYSYLLKVSNADLEAVFGPPRQGDIQDSLADISKAENLFGYDPQIRIEQGLDITYQWFLNNLEFISERA